MQLDPSAPRREARCRETVSAAPKDDWVLTRVVIGAQYASGSRNNRAASSDATAATAVRAECTNTGHSVHSTRSLIMSTHRRDDFRKAEPVSIHYSAVATYDLIIFVGSTTRSNSSSVTKPSVSAAAFRVRSLSIA